MIRRTPLMLWATALLAAIGTAVALVVVASPAAAAACAGAVRFSATSNRLYVSSGTQTPSTILALCPAVPARAGGPGEQDLAAERRPAGRERRHARPARRRRQAATSTSCG